METVGFPNNRRSLLLVVTIVLVLLLLLPVVPLAGPLDGGFSKPWNTVGYKMVPYRLLHSVRDVQPSRSLDLL